MRYLLLITLLCFSVVTVAAERTVAVLPSDSSAASTAGPPREVIFIDTSIKDYRSLLADIPASDEVVYIGPDEDGLGAVAKALAARSGVSAIHIVSHGDAGRIRLGREWIDRSTLSKRTKALSVIGASLGNHGDILLYGCRIGSGDIGLGFMRAFADATGANIAASDDVTGAASKGGNWVLEAHIGDVHTRSLVFPGYAGLLPNGTLTFTSDGGGAWSGGIASDGQGGSVDLTGVVMQILNISDTSGTNLGAPIEWHSAGDLAASNSGLTADYNNFVPWKGIEIKSSDGSEFQINQFQFYDWGGIIGQMDIVGYRNGSQVATNSFNYNSGDFVAVNLDSTFDNVDDVRIVYHSGTGFPAINDIVIADVPLTAPTLTATGTNPSFTEGGSAADLYSTVTAATNDAGQTFAGMTVTVTNVTNGSSETLTIGGTSVPLSNGSSGTITGIGSYSVGVSGSTATVTVSGMTRSNAQMGTLIDGMTYANSNDDPGSSSRVVTITGITDSGGSNNTASPNLASTVSVTPVNDAPTLSATGGTPTYTENGSAVDLFSGVSASTIESGQTITQLTLTVTNVSDGANEILGIDGSMVALTNGNSATTTINSMSVSVSVSAGTATVTVSKIAGVSAATAGTMVDNLTYRDTSSNPATASNRVVTLTGIKDNGGTSNSGVDTTTLSIAATVTVSAVNNAPTITAPGSISVTEDVATALTGISFSDVDGGSSSETATLSVGSGTLAATSGGGVTASGSGTTSLTLTGSIANINTFIAGSNVAFTTASNATSNVTLTVGIDDGGNTGSGGAQSASTTVTLSVTAVNDAPTITAPGSISVTEDVASALTGISFADVDGGSASETATLSVGSGTLAATSGGGVTVSGSGTTSLTLTGSIANVNTFIAGSNLTFTTASNATSNVTLTVGIDDGGNTGAGGAQSASTTVTLSVTAVNDAPTITAPGSISVTEDVASALTGISFADVDGGSASETATLSVGSGTLTATSGGGVTVSGSGTTSLTLTGSVANVNTFIAGSNLTFTTASNATGNVTLTVGIDDGGNTGAGGSQSASTTVTLSVTAVNDAPTITAPGTISVTEDVASALTGISFADVDGGSASETATLSVGSGTLAATSGGGVTVSGSGTTSMTLTGSVANVNTFISGSNLTFTTASNATSNVTLTVGIDDGGNTGAGGSQSASTTVTLSVTAVNDAPTITAPGSISVTEDVASALTGISFADVDGGSASETATLSVGSGTLAATSGGGVTVSGSGTTSLTLAGTLANLNTFIAGSNVAFTTASNATGNVTLTVGIDDGGNTGAGGAQTNSTTVTLAVTAVNDPPVNTVPGAQTLLQNGSLTFSSGAGRAISIADVDAGGAAVQVALTATNGVLSLNGTIGLGFTVGTGTGDASMTFTGTIADINTALDGLVYTPTTGYAGSASLQITTDDQGHSGAGGAQTDTDTVALTVQVVHPVVTGVSSTSPDGSYKVGDTIAVTVGFSAAVTVDTTGGTPTLTLETGATDRAVAYASGSGSGTLTFNYTVQVGDLSGDLDYVSTAALALNGATIRDAWSNDAILALPTVAGASSLGGQKDLVVDGVAPTVASVAVPANGTYATGQHLDVTVTFTEAVVVDASGGTPRLALTIGSATAYAGYVSGSGTSSLVFRRVVQAGDADADGIALAASLDANGGTLRDAAGNDAVLALAGVGSTSGVLVDAIAPTVLGLQRVDATPTNHATLGYTLAFSEDVSGVDLADLAVVATGSASGTLLSVTPVDAATYVIALGSVSGVGTLRVDLAASGTGIVDAAGNPLAGGATGAIYDVDNAAPSVSGVAVPADGTYAAGQDLDFAVTFDEAVVVDTTGGTPRLTLDVGGMTRYADYRSGSGTATLAFRATVLSGDRDDDGIALGGSIDAHGGTLRDAAGNDAALALVGAPSTAGILVHTPDGRSWWSRHKGQNYDRHCGVGNGFASLASLVLFLGVRLRLRSRRRGGR